MARKSIIKRVKFTKRGKMLRRKSGINHFNAKDSRRVQLRRKRAGSFPASIGKRIKRAL